MRTSRWDPPLIIQRDPIDKGCKIRHVNHPRLGGTAFRGFIAHILYRFQGEAKEVQLGPILSSLDNHISDILNNRVGPIIVSGKSFHIFLHSIYQYPMSPDMYLLTSSSTMLLI